MCGKTTEGAQGICPDGWHIPTDEEFKILEGMVDSFYSVSNTEWNKTGWRGNNVGTNLKTGDFSALLAGYRNNVGIFDELGSSTGLWSSSESVSAAWYRGLTSVEGRVYRDENDNVGFSVRCIKD
jgi:uncharacterized protein (TIGR02145 family)